MAGGLSQPTAMAFLPDGRVLVTQKGGALRVLSGTTATTLVTLPVCSGGEMGLLGIAIDPAFSVNGFIYLYRTENAGGCGSADGRSNEIVRVTMAANGSIDLATLTLLLGGIRTDQSNHNGGVLRLGPDTKLWVGVGDTGLGDNRGCAGSSTNPYAQDLGALEGKILRLELDGQIPADNPFVGQAGVRAEIYARGFRNPWRMDFDPLNGRLWVGDVGDFAFEEIDLVDAGENHGWPACEATFPAGCNGGGFVEPLFAYSHGGACPGEASLDSFGASITAGTFAGSAFFSSENAYIFGDFVTSKIYMAMPNLPRDQISTPVLIASDAGGPVDFVRGPEGAVYYLALFDGEVRRLAAESPFTEQALFGAKLRISGVSNLARQRIEILSRDPGINLGAGNFSVDDPVEHGGNLHLGAEDGCDGPCDFEQALLQSPPLQGWSYIGRSGSNAGYRFRGESAMGSLSLLVKPGREVQAKWVGPLGFDLATNPGTMRIRLEMGARSFCLEFGGSQTFVAGRLWQAIAASAPGTCLP